MTDNIDETIEPAFEAHRLAQTKILGMPGLAARPAFYAGYRAAREVYRELVTLYQLPPLPEARIESYQTDATMRVMTLHTYSASDMRAYAAEAVRLEREAAAAICEAKLDVAEEKKAWQKAQDARGGDIGTEFNRLKHYSTVSLWNTALRQCAAAIRARSEL